MSAIVYVPNQVSNGFTPVEVPQGNGYDIDSDGQLHVRTSAWSGDKIAVFKRWDHIVVTPNRGPNGRFAKKGSLL